jgi:hypothetical protein
MIQLRDGSRVVLAKGSKARVEEKDGKTLLRLLQGTGEYVLGARPQVIFFLKDKPAVLEAGQAGVISLDSRRVSGAAGRLITPAGIGAPPPPPVGPPPKPVSSK